MQQARNCGMLARIASREPDEIGVRFALDVSYRRPKQGGTVCFDGQAENARQTPGAGEIDVRIGF